MTTIPPSIPFHVARAYGVALVARTAPAQRPAAPVAPATPVQTSVDHAASLRLARLIAATVPGGIDFSSAEPTPTASNALPMYRHPYDRNAAATGVHAGRVIDVVG